MKYKNIFLFLIIGSFFTSCSSESKYTLPEAEFKQILSEVYACEALAEKDMVQDTALRIQKENYLQSVFKKHNITQEKFQKEVALYSKDPKKFDEILGSIISDLNAKEATGKLY